MSLAFRRRFSAAAAVAAVVAVAVVVAAPDVSSKHNGNHWLGDNEASLT